jgi:rare lipoprotein A (peptidoglycan hydrolase)
MKQIKVFAIAFIAVLCVPYYAQAQFNQAPSGEYFRQEGNASWYGNEFEGRRTASGEIFNSSLLTAAHPTLPFGTFLVVTNRNNNRQVTVKVNDRGPFVANRIIDVSRAAAEQLDMIYAGIAPVYIETMTAHSQPQNYLPPQQGFMQPQATLPQGGLPPQSYMPPQAAMPPQQGFMQPQATLPQGGLPPQSYMPPQAAMPPQGFMQPQAFMQTPAPLPPQGFTQNQAPLPPQAFMQQPPMPQSVPYTLPPQDFSQQPQIQQPHIMYMTPPSAPVPPLPPMASVPAPVQTEQFPSDPVSVIVFTPPQMALPSPAPSVSPAPQVNITPPPLPPVQDMIPEFSAARLFPPMDPQPGKVYKLQIGSYQHAQNAVAAFTRLKAVGLNPSYERAGEMYRVVLAGVRGSDVRSATEKLSTAGFGEAVIREEF